MKYGFFDNQRKEYVITRPDTPTPWINYLSNSQYCAMISNTAGGYSFHIDPKDRRILRYRYNNLPVDRPGRYIYIKDIESADFWSPSWQPVLKKLDSYECRHGLGYTKINSIYSGIETETTYFVPVNDNLEIWSLTIKNTTTQKKTLQVYSYAEFCLFRAENDQNDLQYMQNIAFTEFENETIFFSLYDRLQGYIYFSSNHSIDNFDCDREAFIGSYRTETNPIAIEKGECSCSHANGGNPIAATCTTLELSPGDSENVIFVLGIVQEKPDAETFIQKYHDKMNVDVEFTKLAKKWAGHLEKFQVTTPDKEFDMIVNVWNPYQCRTTFDWSRYVSFYETGIGRGMGFRDSNQDTMGVNHVLSSRVRQRLLDLAANQFVDGHVYHVYYPLTGKGSFPDYINPNMHFFSDDHLWMILAVYDYIKETGDFSILNEKLTFVDGNGSPVALYDHLQRAIDFTVNKTGRHGLPLMGTADWNDTLGLPGPNNSSESIWVAMQLHLALLALIELASEYRKEDITQYRSLAVEMKNRVNGTAWDGEWYIRAYTDTGDPVGSSECKEGQIYLNTQSWAVISSIATDDRATRCMDSAKEHLETEYGIMLLAPPYTKYYDELGGISTFPPCLKENGSIFCHTNPWAIIAECILGRGDIAYSYYKRIAPTTKNDIANTHRAEPYIFSQMIAGNKHPKFGTAKNSWLTGTAAWTMKAAMEWILGVRPDFRGLIVDPCIPRSWKEFRVQRHFRNAIYDIHVKNPDHVFKGVKEVKVDGSIIESDLVPIFNDGKKHTVSITMGSK
ncbi:MAG: GH36-type glycosyl hydrolase domain-containing protein [Candidatus Odinarchaeota archaeon]